MFKSQSPALLECKYLEIKKKLSRLETHKKMLKFCKYISNQPLQGNQIATQNLFKKMGHPTFGQDYNKSIKNNRAAK